MSRMCKLGLMFVAVVMMCAALMGVRGVTALAFDKSSVSIDSNKKIMTVNASDTKLVAVSVVKPKLNKKSGRYNLTRGAWMTYDAPGDAVEVSLSNLTATKDNYIQVRVLSGDATFSDPVTIKFSKNAKKNKVSIKYDASGEPVLKFVSKGNSGKEYAYDELNIRVNDKVVEDSKDVVGALKMCATGGGYVYASIAGTDGDMKAIADMKVYDNKYSTVAREVYDGGMLVSNEVKATVKKSVAAPNVTANYTKGTVTIPKNCEYSFVAKGVKSDEWKAVTSKWIVEIGPDNNQGNPYSGVLRVRKCATATNPSSKVAMYSFNTPVAPVVYASGDPGEDVIENPILGEEVYIVDASKATASYEGIKNAHVYVNVTYAHVNGKYISGTYRLKNNTSIKYQYQVVGKNAVINPEGWATLSSGANASVKALNGVKLYVRQAPDASKGLFASEECLVGWIVYPNGGIAPTTEAPTTEATTEEVTEAVTEVTTEVPSGDPEPGSD